MEIAREAWLRALGESGEPPDPDALTAMELADLLGLGQTAVRVRLEKLLRAGKATKAWKTVIDSAGRTQRVTAYRLVE